MRAIAASVLAGVIALSAAAPAFAEPQRYGYDRRDDRRDWRDDRGDDRRDWRDDRRHDRRDWRDDRRDARWDNRRDYNRWSNHRWSRGDRWDRRDTRYIVINDYHRYRDRYGHNLRHPGRGHYYVRDHRTGDILLVAAATGLVLWALSN